jgi:hypothetical protein
VTNPRLRIPAYVAYRELVRETLVFDLQTGAYRSLPHKTGRLLALIERYGSMEQAAAEIARETGRSLESVRSSVLACCLELARFGLLEIDRRSPASRSSDQPTRVASPRRTGTAN